MFAGPFPTLELVFLAICYLWDPFIQQVPPELVENILFLNLDMDSKIEDACAIRHPQKDC